MITAAGVTVAVFLPSIHNGFVFYDDNLYVTENAHVLEGLSEANVRWAFTSVGYASNWHPLTWLSLMVDVSFAGPGRMSAVMHGHNVLLHTANAALLVLLLSLMCRGRLDGIWLLGIALLWSLHPLRTEVVAWVSERKEALSVFWMLLSLIFHCGGGKGLRDSLRVSLSLLCFVFALLAKPVAVTLPAVILAWDVLYERRIRWGRIIAFSILSFAACWLTICAQTDGLTSGAKQPACSLVNAILGAPIVYLRQTLWPVGLSIVYEVKHSIDWPVVLPGTLLVLLMGVFAVLWLRVRRRSWLDLTVFAIAWLYVGLVPMLGFVKVGSMEHSDRYTYWIGCGAAACLAIGLSRCHGSLDALKGWMERVDGRTYKRDGLRRCGIAGLCLCVIALAGGTRHYLPRWRDSLSLLAADVPKCWSPEFAQQMADEFMRLVPPRVADAEQILRTCAKESPNPLSYRNLSRFLIDHTDSVVGMRGDVPLHYEAEWLLKTVLAKYPEETEAHELLGRIECARQRLKELGHVQR